MMSGESSPLLGIKGVLSRRAPSTPPLVTPSVQGDRVRATDGHYTKISEAADLPSRPRKDHAIRYEI